MHKNTGDWKHSHPQSMDVLGGGRVGRAPPLGGGAAPLLASLLPYSRSCPALGTEGKPQSQKTS